MDVDVVEEDDADAQHHFERQQLEHDRARPCPGRSRRRRARRAGARRGRCAAPRSRTPGRSPAATASRTAIQKRPGATRARMPRSGSSANANSRITMRPNGRICEIATRDRDSIRRSLPDHQPRLPPDAHELPALGPADRAAAATLARYRRSPGPAALARCDLRYAEPPDLAGGQGAGEIELVGRHERRSDLRPARPRRSRAAPRGRRRRARRGARRGAGAAGRGPAPHRARAGGAGRPRACGGSGRRPRRDRVVR